MPGHTSRAIALRPKSADWRLRVSWSSFILSPTWHLLLNVCGLLAVRWSVTYSCTRTQTRCSGKVPFSLAAFPARAALGGPQATQHSAILCALL